MSSHGMGNWLPPWYPLSPKTCSDLNCSVLTAAEFPILPRVCWPLQLKGPNVGKERGGQAVYLETKSMFLYTHPDGLGWKQCLGPHSVSHAVHILPPSNCIHIYWYDLTASQAKGSHPQSTGCTATAQMLCNVSRSQGVAAYSVPAAPAGFFNSLTSFSSFSDLNLCSQATHSCWAQNKAFSYTLQGRVVNVQ